MKPTGIMALAAIFIIGCFFLAIPQRNALADSSSFDFESYAPGSINGQDGWSATGAFDQEVVPNTYGYASFGTNAFRISDAVTSGSFIDQTFSKSLVNEAGETTARTDGFPPGIRQSYFEVQFDIASTMPSAVQPGLAATVSPNGGRGTRMSYLRFRDQADGIHLFFDDYQDVAVFGTLANPAHGCGVGDNFVETDIATLDRSLPHSVKFSMDFIDGPGNDVVKIYIDGNLAHTGTTWEDYYRWCTESGGGVVNSSTADVSRTVDSLLIRESGTAMPANAGNGFLFDNLTMISANPVAPAPVVPGPTGPPLVIGLATVPPLIDMVKIPNPTELPQGPGPVRYTYAVANLGTVSVSNVTVTDIGCSPVTFVLGDTNANNLLDTAETWTYSCASLVNQTTTNIATVTGMANGLTATDTATTTVVVGLPLPQPLIHVVTVPDTLTLPAGGGVVIYRYAITNPGPVPLANVTIADDKCSGLPTQITDNPGDLNQNNLLDPNESFTFICSTNLTDSTMNTATAIGSANGLTTVDSASATVQVAAPGLPSAGIPGFPKTGAGQIGKNITSTVILPFGMLAALSLFYIVRRKRPIKKTKGS
ncbi:MAG: hypothetical protein ABI643_03155 [Candidatus Doudnabacteria bacterium]